MAVEGFIYPDNLEGFGNTGAQRENDHPVGIFQTYLDVPGGYNHGQVSRNTGTGNMESPGTREEWVSPASSVFSEPLLLLIAPVNTWQGLTTAHIYTYI